MAKTPSQDERERAVASAEHARLYAILDSDPVTAIARSWSRKSRLISLSLLFHLRAGGVDGMRIS